MRQLGLRNENKVGSMQDGEHLFENFHLKVSQKLISNFVFEKLEKCSIIFNLSFLFYLFFLSWISIQEWGLVRYIYVCTSSNLCSKLSSDQEILIWIRFWHFSPSLQANQELILLFLFSDQKWEDEINKDLQEFEVVNKDGNNGLDDDLESELAQLWNWDWAQENSKRPLTFLLKIKLHSSRPIAMLLSPNILKRANEQYSTLASSINREKYWIICLSFYPCPLL